MAKLIFGCGFLGTRVARAWRQAGAQVFAMTRRSPPPVAWNEWGIHPVFGDLTDAIRLPELRSLDTVLFAVGYDRSAGRTIEEVYVHGLANALQALPDSVPRLIYISSTGVYGQSDGEWVDEDSPCQPARAGGRACLAAERLLQSDRLGSRSVILRLAGLYGPGRVPKLDDLRDGRPLAVPSSGLLNLIHVEDAARIVLAAEHRAVPPCCYVVADGHAVARREFYQEAARLFGTPPPQFSEPPLDSPAAARAATSKRLRTARVERDLNVPLLYPSYREGLRSLVANEWPSGLTPDDS